MTGQWPALGGAESWTSGLAAAEELRRQGATARLASGAEPELRATADISKLGTTYSTYEIHILLRLLMLLMIYL